MINCYFIINSLKSCILDLKCDYRLIVKKCVECSGDLI